jgi:hypothetical protein
MLCRTYVFNGSNDTSSENKLLPGLTKVNDVNTIISALVDIGSHNRGAVLSSKVALSAEKKLEIFLSGVQNYEEIYNSAFHNVTLLHIRRLYRILTGWDLRHNVEVFYGLSVVLAS